MLGVLVSVCLSAGITIALLLVTRQRLARQFGDVQRRLLQSEQAIVDLKSWRQASTADVQLARLHRGLVRVQENVARRYGPLLPLAEELSRRPATEQRFLSNFDVAGLNRWAESLGVPTEPETFFNWARAIDHAEAGGAVKFAIPTVDLLSIAVALASVAGTGRPIAVDGESVWDATTLLCAALPGTFGGLEFVTPSAPDEIVTLLLDGSAVDGEALASRIAPGGIVISRGLRSELPTFVQLGPEGNVAVHRRTEEPLKGRTFE